MKGLVLGLVAGLMLAPAAWAQPDRAGIEADTARMVPVGQPGPGVAYGGGPVLRSNRTHVIFWQPRASGLTFDPGYRLLVDRFLRDVAAASHSTSNVLGLTGQYTGYGSRPAAYSSQYWGGILDTDPLPPSECTEPPGTGPGWTVCLTDRQLQTEIERVIRERHLPSTHQDVYFLVTPSGLGSCLGTTPTSDCALGGTNGYCGYHQFTNDGRVDYAFIPYNAVPGHCRSDRPRPNDSTADPALSTIAHELAEAVTNPDGDGWSSGPSAEIGDLCISTFGPAIGGSGNRRYNQSIAGGHFYLQDLWSNAQGRCEARAKPDRATFVVTKRSGGTLWFRGQGSDPEGQIVGYTWMFGNEEESLGRTVMHRFHTAGRYRIRLRVTDSWGNWGFYTRTVAVP